MLFGSILALCWPASDAAAQSIEAIDPSSMVAGEAGEVTLTVDGVPEITEVAVGAFATGFVDETVDGSGSVRVSVEVPIDGEPGDYDVRVDYAAGSESVTDEGAFAVLPLVDVDTIEDVVLDPGATGVFRINAGRDLPDFDAIVIADSVSVDRFELVDATTLSVEVTPALDAPPATYAMDWTVGDATGTVEAVLTVNDVTVEVDEIARRDLSAGESGTVTLTGTFLSQIAVIESPRDDIEVVGFEWSDAGATATVELRADAAAAVGGIELTATTLGGAVIELGEAGTVLPTWAVTEVEPVEIDPGDEGVAGIGGVRNFETFDEIRSTEGVEVVTISDAGEASALVTGVVAGDAVPGSYPVVWRVDDTEGRIEDVFVVRDVTPELSVTEPVVLEPGDEVMIEISGTFLGQVAELLSERDDVQTDGLEAGEDGALRITVAVDPDAAPGPLTLSGTTLSGGEIGSFSVGRVAAVLRVATLDPAALDPGSTGAVELTSEMALPELDEIAAPIGVDVLGFSTTSATSLTVDVLANADATPGDYDLTWSSGEDEGLIEGAVIVNAVEPVVSSIEGVELGSSETGVAIVTGTFLAQIERVEPRTDDVSVEGLFVGDDGRLEITLTAGPDVDPGPIEADALTRAGESFALGEIGELTVTTSVEAVRPARLERGGEATMFVSGTGLDRFNAAEIVGDGIVVTEVEVESHRRIRLRVVSDDRTAAGPRTLILRGGSGLERTIVDAFAVVAGPVELIFIDPVSGARGEEVVVTFGGRNLDMVDRVTVVDDVEVVDWVASSPVRATATFRLLSGAPGGSHDVRIRAPGSSDVLLDAFEVIGAPPELLSVAPASGTRGETIEVTLTGRNLDVVDRVSFGPRVVVGSFDIVDATRIDATIEVRDGAAAGPREVSVRAEGETANLADGFEVLRGPIEVIDVTPARLMQGERATLTLEGFNLDGITRLSLGEGVTLSDIDAAFPTRVTATVEVSREARPGFRALEVDAPAGALNLTDAFVVAEFRLPEPDVSFPSRLDVGDVQIGALDVVGVLFENRGEVDERVTIAAASGDADLFAIIPPERTSGFDARQLEELTIDIDAGGEAAVQIAFLPIFAAGSGARFTVSAREDAELGEIAVTGRGIREELGTQPTSPFSFGDVRAGETALLTRIETVIIGDLTSADAPEVTGHQVWLDRDGEPFEITDETFAVEVVSTRAGLQRWGALELDTRVTLPPGEYSGAIVLETDSPTAPLWPFEFVLTAIGGGGGDDVGGEDVGGDAGGADAGDAGRIDSGGNDVGGADVPRADAAPGEDTEEDGASADVADDAQDDAGSDGDSGGGGGGCTQIRGSHAGPLGLVFAVLALLAVGRRRRR